MSVEPETNQASGSPNASRWYALRTRSRHEKMERDQLDHQGIEHLLPTVKRLSQWKDRKKEVKVPLFAGYCFVRFGSDQKLPILKTVGVVDIVGSGQRPEPIPDEEIAAIRTLMASDLPYDAHPYLQEGNARRRHQGATSRHSRETATQRITPSYDEHSATHSKDHHPTRKNTRHV